MELELEGQTAIVTGAGRGIGRAIALELATLGAAVAVVDRDGDTAGRTADEVGAAGRGVVQLGLQPGEYRQQRASRIPLGRLGEPDDVARVVGFLASARSAY